MRFDSPAWRRTSQPETGRKPEIFIADLTNKGDLLRVEDRLRSEAGVTLLVNNAGFGATAPLAEDSLPRTRWNR